MILFFCRFEVAIAAEADDDDNDDAGVDVALTRFGLETVSLNSEDF
jgi:hypothetical protein